MRGDLKISPELEDCIKQLRLSLLVHLRLIDGLIAVLTKHESAKHIRQETIEIPQEVAGVVAILIQAAGSSSNTLLKISDSPGLQTRDCYSIARSILEVSINACFIMSKGVDEAERAKRHARQKTFKDLERRSVVGVSTFQLRVAHMPEVDAIDGLERDIDEFTSRSGREKGWIDLSIDERIAQVGESFGELGRSVEISLHWSRFAIYRHSSEILHGTFFGALYFLGASLPTETSLEERTEHLGSQLMMVILSCVSSLSAIVECFHAAYGFKSAYDESNQLIKSIQELEYFQRNKSEEDAA